MMIRRHAHTPGIIHARGLRKVFTIPSERRTSIRELFAQRFRRTPSKTLVAVDDVSFTIQKGEFVGIIGNNGCGKTTLLRILAGIYPPDKGAVRIHGHVSPLLELGTGFNPELSARDNIMVNGCILGIPLKTLKRCCDEILEFAGVREFASLKVKNFSSGMTSRLAFAIASRVEADVYLMDEVFAVGDHDFKNRCLERLEALKRDNRTIVLVTHSLDSVRTHGNRCLLLEHGRLTYDGTPKACIEHYIGPTPPPCKSDP